MRHEGPPTLGPMEIVHWSAILSLALSLFVALVSALWWRGWLTWTTGVLGNLVGLVILFGPFVMVPLAIAATLFALYQAWQLGSRESLFLAIPGLLIALLTFKWLFDNWAAN